MANDNELKSVAAEKEKEKKCGCNKMDTEGEHKEHKGCGCNCNKHKIINTVILFALPVSFLLLWFAWKKGYFTKILDGLRSIGNNVSSNT